MSLPYQETSSGERAAADLQKILNGFGCDRFGTMVDRGQGELIMNFTYRGRDVSVKASMKGYAAAWLKEGPSQHPNWPTEYYGSWRAAYRALWDSLNEKRGFGWVTSPWVWVVEFRRVL